MSYKGYPDPTVVRVRANPGPGEYGSVSDALAAITDNSQTNLYAIQVDPGIFTTSTITMKPYVILSGTKSTTVLVHTGGPDANLINATYDTAINDITLVQNPAGAHGTGYAIYYDGTGASAANALTLNTIRFGRCSNLMMVDGSANPALVFGVDVSWGGTASFGAGFEVIGGNLAQLKLRSCITVATQLTAPLPSYFIYAHGANATVQFSSISINTNTVTSTPCIWMNDGASLVANALIINGWGTGIYTDAVGAPPDIHVSSGLFQNNTTDLQIDHPTTTGTFLGGAAHTKVSNSSPSFTWTFLDFDDGELEIRQSLAITYDDGTHTEVLSLFQAQGVGLVEGGVLSDNPGFLEANVSAGYGYYVDGSLKRLDWDATVAELPPNSVHYVYFNSLGNLTTNATKPSFGSTILLGRVGTDSSGVYFIDNLPRTTTYLANQNAEQFQAVFGTLYATGSITTAGTAPNNVNVSNGSYWIGGVEFTPAGGNDISFDKFYQSATPGEWTVVVGATVVPDDFYDDGSGTLAAIPAGEWVKHLLYVVGDGVDEKYFLVYAQATHVDQATAEAATLPSAPTYFTEGIVRIASFVIQEGSGSITTFLSERPLSTTQLSASAAVTAHTALTGLTTGDAGHTQFDMLDGSTPRAANMNLGGFQITNVGNVDGVDVSAHASRHLPLGADPISTAAPLVAVSASTTNQMGTANTLARSDHQHAFDATTIVTQTITNGVVATAPSEDAVFDALTLKLDANAPIIGATKTKVTYDAGGLVTAGADATTADIADSADKRYVTDAQLVVIENTSGVNTGDNAANSSTTYIGTTAIALNRTSASQALTGITSIDGSAATLTTSRDINGVAFDGSANITITADPNTHASTHLPGGSDELTTAAAGTIAIGAASAAGVAASFSRADHVHALPAPAAPSSVGTTNSTGVATTAARADHVHNHGVQTDGSLHAEVVAAGASGFMSGTDKTKLDSISSGAAALTASTPADVTRAAAVVGVSTTAARADHKHDVLVAAPSALVYGGAGSTGTSSSLAAADHVHAIGHPAGRIVSYNQVVGTTSGPTTASSTYTLLSEMTVTFTPASATNYVEVDFNGTFSNSNANRNVAIAIFIDGVQQANTERTGTSAAAATGFTLAVKKMFQLSTTSHTITIQWKRDANTGTATGVDRVLLVKEIAS